jgi:uncharacterized protein (DUF2126 family)
VTFSTSIQRLGHEARPTAPYTDDVWLELLAAGDRADAALTLAGHDVWIGGEPTFTARENQAREEWQGGALGPDKWNKGRALADTLRDRLAPGGAVFHRMGKAYPGESLPRWALDVIGRRDGQAIWPQRTLDDAATSVAAADVGHVIAAALGIKAELHPAFEDPWEVLRAEATLPVDVDPRKAGLDDPEERRRLVGILDRGVGSVVGYVLPLTKDKDGWRTERWAFRRGHLFLIPGDSPIGFRLPLGALAPGATPPLWTEAPDLPDPRRAEPDEAQAGRVTKEAPVQAKRPDEKTLGVRTALTIQPRDGQLWVFLPPLSTFDDFCALLAAIDQARERTGHAIHLEGYPPPPSPQRTRFAVTPDPGVLEVNLPPQTSCREAAELHGVVYEAALGNGLTAERYLLDGRLAGSGGGNHITIGSATAADSPWLREPALLASLVTFLQHHPSLSYAFTGMFVGPTSQAPRIDEARHDALYELELALPKLFDTAAPPPAWQVDALLRHVLVDVAGSTHRAEISIDKLFDPGTPFGRQGIVELRAFEMPPHPRMLTAQAVLVRALVASFTGEPYKHPLVRWGQELHDRFLLPYFLWRDLEDVLAHLATRGIALPAEAYRPFVEMRCPLVGEIEVGDARIEVRNAIEPWHVLGEEASAAGTSRYVDSSMERIELRSHGLDPERYTVAVNGITAPLRAAKGRDTRVGGVRFRAWCPPHALHPHLGIHHPLKIDVIDTWAKRGVAAGTYHVWHPLGRGYEAPPLTRVEAVARRAARFTVEGPSLSPLRPLPADPRWDSPYTLDLRQLDAGHPMPKDEDWK